MTDILNPFRVPDGTVCANCGQRPATAMWVGEGGVMAMTHGGGTWWCGVCTTQAQLEYAQRQAERIPELEAKLRDLLTRDTA